MQEKNAYKCPYCHTELKPWMAPSNSTWGESVQYVCFNDECDYFLRGWKWMMEKFSARASYRYKYNPETGEKGPLPVWSKDALKSSIVNK